MKKKKFTFISFFSGIEGFRLGLEASGWKCIHSVEIEPHCGDVQQARYGRRPETLDITRVKAKDLPDADLWVAGWPCQGLSVAGLRKGLADDRSGLFWQFVRLLERKRPARLLAENVPGLLTTCSCARCGFQCKDCSAQAGAEDEACEVCGSERLGGRVLPEHRGTDLFVVLTALQRLGYGVQTRILDAQHLGVPQRRRRIFFVGRLGAPSRPEILFEPESGARNHETRRQARAHTASESSDRAGDPRRDAGRDVSRSVSGVSGGPDFAAGKGTIVRDKAASPVTTGGFQDRGDGLDNIVAKSITASAGHHGHSSPRGDGSDNLIPQKAATLGTNHKPDRGQRNENIVAATLQSPAGGQRTTDTENLIQREVAPTVTSRQHKGGFTDPGNDGLVPVPAPTAFHRNSSCNVADQKGKAAALKANGEHSYQFLGIPKLAAPITAGSNPNSNAAGRRREDDENLVAAATLVDHKGGDQQPIVAAPKPPPAKGELIQQPLFIHTADGGANQNQVKTDGKADCLSKAQPGCVAFNWQARGKQDRMNISAKGTDALSRRQTPAVAYNVKGLAQGGVKHAYETQTSMTVDREGSRPSGNEAGTLIGPTPMSVRRLTPTECERLQGFPDGWTCLCGVRPDCPDRRCPPWLDPKSFKLGGCGHSSCGCTCADSPRYKALGNAVATCAVEWIGSRMKAMEESR